MLDSRRPALEIRPLLIAAVLAGQALVTLLCVRAGQGRGPWPWPHRGGAFFVPVLIAVPLTALLARALGRACRASDHRAYLLLGAATFSLLSGLASTRAMYRPEGDEPWYLVQAESLWRDRDLTVTPAELAERSAWHFGTPLTLPAEGQLGEVAGRWRVEHWPALSLFLAPATAFHNRALPELLMALAVAMGLAVGARAFAKLGGSTATGVAVALGILGAGPLGQFALLLFPDALAAALWMLGLGLATELEGPGMLLGGLCCGSLVWLRPPLVLLAPAGFVGAYVARGKRPLGSELRPFALGLGGMIAGFVAFQLAIDGRLNPQVMTFAPAGIPKAIARSLLEPERGLGPSYPLVLAALALAAWLFFTRREARVALAIVLGGVGAYVAVISAFVESAGVGGWCPPARFWVPLVPPLATALLVARPLPLEDRRWRALALALGAMGVMTNLMLDLRPFYAFTDRGRGHWAVRMWRS